MRGALGAAQQALDAPSTSGRCVPDKHVLLVPDRRRGRRRRAWTPPASTGGSGTHFELPAYNTRPLPGWTRPPPDGVVAGARTTATPRLSPDRVMQLLAETRHDAAARHFGAFYSSELGGIVMEPAFMVLPVDDHIVHRGDAVAESVPLAGGYLYQLDEHFARFVGSAAAAGLPLPHSEARLRRILLDTAAASLKMNGTLYFWLSRGRGGFGLGDTFGPTFYALLSAETAYLHEAVDRNAGWTAVSTPLDPESPYFHACRNTSRIASAVAFYEAAARGADLAVFTDVDGTVLYGPDVSLGMLTKDEVLVLPPAETGLAGLAVENLARLTMKHAAEEDYLTIRSIERRTFKTDELAGALEAFAISTRLGVVGLSRFDDQPIGDGEYIGEAGPNSLGLNEILVLDAQPRPGSTQHTEVPYGYVTGMKDQLV